MKCNLCISTVSWDECKKNEKQVTCPDSEVFCFTAYVEAEHLNYSGLTYKMYSKGCANSYECTQKICRNISQSTGPLWNVSKCNLECCQSAADLCNSYQDSHHEALVPTTTFLPGEN